MKFGIQPDKSGFVWIHRTIDLLTPLLAVTLILLLIKIEFSDRYLLVGIFGGLIFTITSQTFGTYSFWRARPFFSSFKLVLKAWLMTWVLLIVLAFLFKDADNFSRSLLVSWAILTPVLLVTYRLIIRSTLSKYRSTKENAKQIIIIGAGKVGKDIASIFNENKWLGYNIAGFIDDDANKQNSQINGIEVISTTENLKKTLEKQKVNEVYICLPQSAEKKVKQILNTLTNTTVIVKYVPDLFSFDLMHAKWTELKGYPIISVYDTPLNSTTSKFIKRTEDIVLSLIILMLISPLLAWVAYKVKKSSPGPIIFKQKRYGINGEKIKVYKFRSMTSLDNGSVVKQATKGDARVTKFGAFIRRTSLDELPQFVNVLQGKMSIVGPRPHAVAHNEEYRKLIPKYMQRHIVKPGITGWAQINGWRGETDTLNKMEKRIEFDLHYIKNWTVWLDIKIIILTLFKGFINKNAF